MFGLFMGLFIVGLCEIAYLRIIVIMETSHRQKINKHRVPGLPMICHHNLLLAKLYLRTLVQAIKWVRIKRGYRRTDE